MSDRPHQRAERTEEPNACDAPSIVAAGPQSSAEKPSRRQRGRKWRCFLQPLHCSVLSGIALCIRCWFGNRGRERPILNSNNKKALLEISPGFSSTRRSGARGLQVGMETPGWQQQSWVRAGAPSHPTWRAPTAALPFSCGVYRNHFLFFLTVIKLCWHNRNKHTQYCNTETILELKTIKKKKKILAQNLIK
ncbi:hypothetical protein CIB84_015455 [Bambusicola thoracicus]|uniref:Uncharacterized protein n=1 Tax=Bambusicola thoracicus TaxID=9083 RepID=A0A2P4S9K9_BAMTH|nr:hypothetical protein CIB84_015455 [Bambusicola thoracicus]